MTDLINGFWILGGLIGAGFIFIIIADYFNDRRR